MTGAFDLVGNRQARMAVWRRHDVAGHEACRVAPTDDGWRVEGVAVLVHERRGCRLDYAIECDARWVTRSALVKGWVGGETVDVAVARSVDGRWQLDGSARHEVEGCVDVDLNFSPSTNLLPVRRLALEVGATATVRAAWLRFPSFALEPLVQSYTRVALGRYRYESAGGRFVAELTVDDAGLVIDYGKYWSREAAD